MPKSFMFCLSCFIHVGSLFPCYICLSLLCMPTSLKCTIMIKIQFHTILDRDNIINTIVHGVTFPWCQCSLPLSLSHGFLFLALTFTAHQRASDTLQLLSTGAPRPPRFTARMIPLFLMSVLKVHPTSLHISVSSLTSPFPSLGVDLFSSASSPVSTLLPFLFYLFPQSIQPILCFHFFPTCHGMLISR